MKIKPAFPTSILISIALTLFARFGISAYAQLFVFMFEQIEATWIVGTGLFVVAKAVQSTPLCYRLGVVKGIRYEWLAFSAIVATGLDIAVTLTAWSWVEGGSIKLLNIIVSIGSIGWAGLVRLMVLQWLPDSPLVVPPFVQVTQLVNNSAQHPQDVARTVFQPQNIGVAEHPRSAPSDSQFVSQLIPRVSSLFVVGLSGSGKDFTTSVLADHCRQRHNAKIFYIDPKKSDNEVNLWESVADYTYSFKGFPMSPDEYLDHLKTAFSQYMDRLDANGGEHYTILVLNELATCATKIDNSNDKKWLAATLQPMISGLDSEGGAVWVLTQTTSMPTGFSNGIVSQFQKIIICRENQIENLTTQNQNTLMKGVDLEGVRNRCKESEIDRAIYSSSLMKWLPLPAMRQGMSYYDRDSRRWVGTPPDSGDRKGNSENEGDSTVLPEVWQSGGNHENLHDSAIATPLTSGGRDYGLEDAILEFFQSVDGARNLNQIATSRRVRSAGGNAARVRDCLHQLSKDGLLLSVGDTWSAADLN